MLRYTGYDNTTEDSLRPIPFPRDRADRARRRKSPGRDAGQTAEQALDLAQQQLDRLSREIDDMLNDPLPFPGLLDDGDDDRPPAA